MTRTARAPELSQCAACLGWIQAGTPIQVDGFARPIVDLEGRPRHAECPAAPAPAPQSAGLPTISTGLIDRTAVKEALEALEKIQASRQPPDLGDVIADRLHAPALAAEPDAELEDLRRRLDTPLLK